MPEIVILIIKWLVYDNKFQIWLSLLLATMIFVYDRLASHSLLILIFTIIFRLNIKCTMDYPIKVQTNEYWFTPLNIYTIKSLQGKPFLYTWGRCESLPILPPRNISTPSVALPLSSLAVRPMKAIWATWTCPQVLGQAVQCILTGLAQPLASPLPQILDTSKS